MTTAAVKQQVNDCFFSLSLSFPFQEEHFIDLYNSVFILFKYINWMRNKRFYLEKKREKKGTQTAERIFI